MILTASEILKQYELGNIIIDPFQENNLSPNSIDLTLGSELFVYDELTLDMKKENRGTYITIPDEGYVLYPRELYLACTNEKCGSDKYVCQIEGRSSIGRLGVSIHHCAGWGDLGFKQEWTLELEVIKPIRIYKNVRICQAVFYQIEGEITKIYTGKYVSQKGPMPSRMWKDFLK
jgi:dCTP deaminase